MALHANARKDPVLGDEDAVPFMVNCGAYVTPHVLDLLPQAIVRVVAFAPHSMNIFYALALTLLGRDNSPNSLNCVLFNKTLRKTLRLWTIHFPAVLSVTRPNAKFRGTNKPEINGSLEAFSIPLERL
jgi:hypothetical protein